MIHDLAEEFGMFCTRPVGVLGSEGDVLHFGHTSTVSTLSGYGVDGLEKGQ